MVGRLRRHASQSVLALVPIDYSTGTAPDRNGESVASIASGGAFHPTAAGQIVLAGAVRRALAPTGLVATCRSAARGG